MQDAHWQEAREKVLMALMIDQQCGEAYRLNGLIHYSLGQYQACAADLERYMNSIDHDPDADVEALLQRVHAHLKQEQEQDHDERDLETAPKMSMEQCRAAAQEIHQGVQARLSTRQIEPFPVCTDEKIGGKRESLLYLYCPVSLHTPLDRYRHDGMSDGKYVLRFTCGKARRAAAVALRHCQPAGTVQEASAARTVQEGSAASAVQEGSAASAGPGRARAPRAGRGRVRRPSAWF